MVPVAEDVREGWYSDTEDGLEAGRVFTVHAVSDINALATLQRYRRIFRGTVFQNYRGETPSNSLICRDFSIRTVSAAPLGGTGLYEITVSYAEASSSDDEPTPGGPATYRRIKMISNEQIDRDRNGKPITNSKGQGFKPGVVVPKVQEKVVFEWFQEGVTGAQVSAWRGYDLAINSDEFQGADPGELLCMGVVEGSVKDSGWVRCSAEMWWRSGSSESWTNDTGADVNEGDIVNMGESVGIASEDIADEATGSVYVIPHAPRPVDMDGDGNLLDGAGNFLATVDGDGALVSPLPAAKRRAVDAFSTAVFSDIGIPVSE